MARWPIILIACLVFIGTIPLVSGGTFEDQSVVDIERYVDIPILKDGSDPLEISAEITSLNYPITILLIKGDEEYEKFRQSDLVDLSEIEKGNLTDPVIPVTIVSGFSAMNVTRFIQTIRISDRDSYHLVIMLYRDSSMDPDEVLTTRVTLVNIKVEWDEVVNQVPWFLVPVAIILAIIGIALVTYYFWPRKKEEPPTPQPRHYRRSPIKGR